MAISFNINTYDLIQRATSTAEALHELGTEPLDAAHEAAETVLDDREDTISEKAYIIESIAATGPGIDKEVVSEIVEREREEDTVSELVNSLLLGVLTSASMTETFDEDVAQPITEAKEPQDTYDADPEAIVSLFATEAEQSGEGDGYEAAGVAIAKHEDKVSQLSFTALAIAVQHLSDEHGVDATVTDFDLTSDSGLNKTGIELFQRSLATYLQQDEEYRF